MIIANLSLLVAILCNLYFAAGDRLRLRQRCPGRVAATSAKQNVTVEIADLDKRERVREKFDFKILHMF